MESSFDADVQAAQMAFRNIPPSGLCPATTIRWFTDSLSCIEALLSPLQAQQDSIRILWNEVADRLANKPIDEVMRTLSESYTWHLNNFINTKNVVNMLLKFQDAAKLKYAVNVIEIPDIDSNSLKDALEQAQVGVNGVAALVAYDVNLALEVDGVPVPKGEAGALSHGLSTWSSVAAFDAASASDHCDVVLAAAYHVIVVGRLWRTSLNRLSDAIKNIKWHSVEMRDGEPVNVPNLGDGSASIVVIDAR